MSGSIRVFSFSLGSIIHNLLNSNAAVSSIAAAIDCIKADNLLLREGGKLITIESIQRLSNSN
jgi:hypothetical protein